MHVAEVVCVSACIPHLWGGGGGGVGGARQAVVGATELRGMRALENVQACIGVCESRCERVCAQHVVRGQCVRQREGREHWRVQVRTCA